MDPTLTPRQVLPRAPSRYNASRPRALGATALGFASWPTNPKTPGGHACGFLGRQAWWDPKWPCTDAAAQVGLAAFIAWLNASAANKAAESAYVDRIGRVYPTAVPPSTQSPWIDAIMRGEAPVPAGFPPPGGRRARPGPAKIPAQTCGHGAYAHPCLCANDGSVWDDNWPCNTTTSQAYAGDRAKWHAASPENAVLLTDYVAGKYSKDPYLAQMRAGVWHAPPGLPKPGPDPEGPAPDSIVHPPRIAPAVIPSVPVSPPEVVTASTQADERPVVLSSTGAKQFAPGGPSNWPLWVGIGIAAVGGVLYLKSKKKGAAAAA